ncbi:DUF6655 family protein [Tautonia marina]|uniref:DUF6655 family protein n=1 Tax=Tautonia marina TaxID=2653855 RepID=UPI001260D370|nr:DUF6655 family protein [Tautonia marina]
MGRSDRREIGRTARMAVGAVVLLIGAGSGCGSIRVTDTPRSATEQLLLTQAWDEAIGSIDFSQFAATPVKLDDALLAGPDKNWMVYRLRESMARQGVILVDDKEKAEVVIEAAAGVYGTNSNSVILGIPANNMMGALPFVPPMAMGEAALATRTDQYGVTRLALFARDTATGHFVWESGTIDADSYLRNATIGGIALRSGSIELPSDRHRRRMLHRLTGRGEPPPQPGGHVHH